VLEKDMLNFEASPEDPGNGLIGYQLPHITAIKTVAQNVTFVK